MSGEHPFRVPETSDALRYRTRYHLRCLQLIGIPKHLAWLHYKLNPIPRPTLDTFLVLRPLRHFRRPPTQLRHPASMSHLTSGRPTPISATRRCTTTYLIVIYSFLVPYSILADYVLRQPTSREIHILSSLDLLLGAVCIFIIV